MAMDWFLAIVVGCLVWAYLSVALNRRNIDEFNQKERKAAKYRSRLLHPPFKG
jgi:hypothetical protein